MAAAAHELQSYVPEQTVTQPDKTRMPIIVTAPVLSAYEQVVARLDQSTFGPVTLRDVKQQVVRRNGNAEFTGMHVVSIELRPKVIDIFIDATNGAVPESALGLGAHNGEESDEFTNHQMDVFLSIAPYRYGNRTSEE